MLQRWDEESSRGNRLGEEELAKLCQTDEIGEQPFYLMKAIASWCGTCSTCLCLTVQY